MAKKEKKLYRDKEWYSLYDLADFIAEFNKDGKYDKKAWEFWNWFDKKCKISDEKILAGEQSNKSTEKWEKEFEELVMEKGEYKFVSKPTLKSFIAKTIQQERARLKDECLKQYGLGQREGIEYARAKFDKVLEGLKKGIEKYWDKDAEPLESSATNPIILKIYQAISIAQKRIK